MSWKIYNAWRTRDLMSFYKDIKEYNYFTMYLRILQTSIALGSRTDKSEPSCELLEFAQKGFHFICKKYKKQLGNNIKSFFDIDFTFEAFKHGAYWYIVPCIGAFWDTTEIYDYINQKYEQYHYWNNVDKDSDVTERQWKSRKRVWSSIEKSGWDSVTLQLVRSNETHYWDPIGLYFGRSYNPKLTKNQYEQLLTLLNISEDKIQKLLLM